jgi:mannosyltransferase OCH1-like enzyme
MTDSPAHHRQRSEFIRRLVQRPVAQLPIRDWSAEGTPRTIVQFWHNPQELPGDVKECITSWVRWSKNGFTHRLFDEHTARAFIGDSLDARHKLAFDRCYHPAMQADYFRLCYLVVEGGFYVDADDVCVGTHIDWLFNDSRLKVQPLCYDVASGTMVHPSAFLPIDAFSPSWIFYFNNNPLIAARRHPIIEHALQQATHLLEHASEDVLPEIQATTGPGNLSKSIFELGTMSRNVENDLVVLGNWDSLAVSRWPLSHRGDARNWRLSNQQRFRRIATDSE